MRKQLYIRDEDAPLWREAELIASGSGVSLSSLVSEALEFYLGWEPRMDDESNSTEVLMG